MKRHNKDRNNSLTIDKLITKNAPNMEKAEAMVNEKPLRTKNTRNVERREQQEDKEIL